MVDKLVEECINVIDGHAMYNETSSIDPNDCLSRTPYVVIFIVVSSISVVISGVFVYFRCYKNEKLGLKNDVPGFSYSKTETEIY